MEWYFWSFESIRRRCLTKLLFPIFVEEWSCWLSYSSQFWQVSQKSHFLEIWIKHFFYSASVWIKSPNFITNYKTYIKPFTIEMWLTTLAYIIISGLVLMLANNLNRNMENIDQIDIVLFPIHALSQQGTKFVLWMMDGFVPSRIFIVKPRCIMGTKDSVNENYILSNLHCRSYLVFSLCSISHITFGFV